MELSVIHSRALAGIEAPDVQVETHLSNGLPSFQIVGMAETAVKESRERVRSALLNSHLEFPNRRITVNLAPADLPKEGGRFDLPIALGILQASGQLPARFPGEHEFVGELALDGRLRRVPGLVSAARAAQAQARNLVVPDSGAFLAAHVPGSTIIPTPDLLTLCAHLNGNAPITPLPRPPLDTSAVSYPDLEDVVGQAAPRRALEIAASGGHNLLLHGPPGTGKTLLARRLPGILPPLTETEALEGLCLQNAAGREQPHEAYARPFRSPHHSASPAALAGGGGKPVPGEISLAHGGVLFLDELPEFRRSALEILREPLESGEITLSRARHRFTYPARFQLIAAMNPCPCGHAGDVDRSCRCTPGQIDRYRARLSGPLLERIDLHIAVNRVDPAVLLRPGKSGDCSTVVRERVCEARQRQLQRQGCTNATLPAAEVLKHCLADTRLESYLAKLAGRLQLSGRALHRSLRVARTIADLAAQEQVCGAHLDEAIAYRPHHVY